MRIDRITSLLLLSIGSLVAGSANAGMGDDPLLVKVMSEFEYLSADGEDILEWDVDAWVGRDLSKIWVKSSGEANKHNGDGIDVEQANIELVFSRAVYTTWDQQFGVRHDLKPNPEGSARSWVSFGYIGTAPYFIDVDARVFLGERSSSQLLIELEKEVMLTQEWVLTPELDIVANGRSNPLYGEGSGLSEVEFSLRLGYEANGNRKFQPFIGVSARQTFGETRRMVKSEGDSSGDITAILGVHSWF